MFCPLWHIQWAKKDAIQQSSTSATNQISTFLGLGDPTFRYPRSRARGYQLLSQTFRLPNVLPRSGATRQNWPAGPGPFERARPLLQISSLSFSEFRRSGHPRIELRRRPAANQCWGEHNSSSKHFVFAKVGHSREESSKFQTRTNDFQIRLGLILRTAVCATGVWCRGFYPW